MRRCGWILLLIGFAIGEPLQGEVVDSSGSLPVNPKKKLYREYSDSAIYQGCQLKLDLGSTVYELGMSHGKTQSYEMAFNVRLKGRFYPTVEGGVVPVAHNSTEAGTYDGAGGFVRIGLDINPFRNTAGRSAFLVGVRYANSWQHYRYTDLVIPVDPYWESLQFPDTEYHRFDAWFEVLLGVQVQVHKAFYMGLNVRLKILGSRSNKHGNGIVPAYIPGFGDRSDTNYGLNYYVAIGI